MVFIIEEEIHNEEHRERSTSLQAGLEYCSTDDVAPAIKWFQMLGLRQCILYSYETSKERTPQPCGQLPGPLRPLASSPWKRGAFKGSIQGEQSRGAVRGASPKVSAFI